MSLGAPLVIAATLMAACGGVGGSRDNASASSTTAVAPAAFAHVERLEVATGGYPVDRTGTVAASARDAYEVDAVGGAGEKIDARLTTSSGKATLQVLGPDGAVLGTGENEVHVLIPGTGILKVVVASTRGPAVYRVSIGVSQPAD